MEQIVSEIKNVSRDAGQINIMEVCGGHTHTIVKYGIKDVLPENINLISGPGCPVCVTSQRDIDNVVELALKGIKIVTYADLLKVPGTKMSLEDARSRGSYVKSVYSVEEVLNEKDAVFFSIGFETTTPMTAYLLKNNVVVYSTNRLLIPVLELIKEDSFIDGFILPGHVSAIIGSEVYKDLGMPGVISGFEPEDILSSILILIKIIKSGKNDIVNNYKKIVSEKGNRIAQKLINETMVVSDMSWRGFGTIPNSGLEPRNPGLNAKIVFKDILKDIESREIPGCRCPEIIKGKMSPKDCPLFGKVCTPSSPKGPCMVSSGEGVCNIEYSFKYRG